MNKIKKIIDYELKYASWISFSIEATIIMVYLSIRNITKFYYDAAYYWVIANACFDGKLSLRSFPETFRGCLYTIFLSAIRVCGNIIHPNGGIVLYRILVALCLSVFLTFILPYIFEKKIKLLKDVIRQLILLAVVLFYWGNYFCFPLSDFATLFFLICAIAIGKEILRRRVGIITFIEGIAVGGLLYLTYNTRVAYIYSCLFCIVYLIIFSIRRRIIRVDLIIGALIGVIIFSTPQALINYKYTGSYAPIVHTEQLLGESLIREQLLWGLTYDNYETYLGASWGDYSEYPEAAVYFDDSVGKEIVQREGITIENLSLLSIVRLFIKYPLDMISIYMRHFVALMTPKFQETYITNIYVNKGIAVALIILLWFVAVVNILKNIQNKKINLKLMVQSFILFIPGLLQVGGAPELRFFIAIHMMGYFYVVCYIDYHDFLLTIKKYIFPMAISFCLFAFLWISVVSSILSSNREKTLLINDRNIYRIENNIDSVE